MTLQSALPVSERRIEPQDVTAMCGQAEAESAALSLVAIVIGSDDDRCRLIQTLKALDAQVVVHENLRTLRRCLLRGDVDLVITDVTLPDANWADVLRLIVRASLPTDILVHCRTLDESLRSEAIGRGASGLLVPPYSIETMTRIVQNALPQNWPRTDYASLVQ